MSIAFIKVGTIQKQEPGWVNFKSADQLTWNCNKEELLSLITPGACLKVDFNETEPKPGHKFGSKWINNARPMQAGEQLTRPDKEPYGGGAPRSNGNGKKSDYDPEVGKRQTAANCAANYLAQQNLTVEDFKNAFPQVADAVYAWVNEAPKSNAGAAPEPTNELDQMLTAAKSTFAGAGEDDDVPF